MPADENAVPNICLRLMIATSPKGDFTLVWSFLMKRLAFIVRGKCMERRFIVLEFG